MELNPPKRPVHWVGNARDRVKEMPEEVKDVIGRSLLQVQLGGRPRNAVVMQGFTGAGILEIKDDYDGDTYRCVYTVRFAEAVYVLHAFQKKSTTGIKTSKRDIDLIRLRLQVAEDHYKDTYAVPTQGGEDENQSNRGKR